MTKWGVTGFSEALRQEALHANIRVTVVEPGFVETELLEHNAGYVQDAAQKLNADPDFKMVPPPLAYWLSKRAKSGFEGKPSTWTNGIGKDTSRS